MGIVVLIIFVLAILSGLFLYIPSNSSFWEPGPYSLGGNSSDDDVWFTAAILASL